MLTKKVIYEGRVQGVGFRYCTKQLALGFDVIGSIKNLPNGTVELLIEGEEEEVTEFLEELEENSAVSHHIKNAYPENIPPLDGAKGFIIEK